jgi:hypothetical protein
MTDEVRKAMEGALDLQRKTMEAGGKPIVATALIYQRGGSVQPFAIEGREMEDDRSKDLLRARLLTEFLKLKASMLIFVSDAWMATCDASGLAMVKRKCLICLGSELGHKSVCARQFYKRLSGDRFEWGAIDWTHAEGGGRFAFDFTVEVEDVLER